MNPDVIDRYALGAELFRFATQGLSLEQETARPGPGAWSIREVAAHLADADAVIADRMKRVIAEPEPKLLAFDESAWAAGLHYQEQPIARAAALFEANRLWMVEILKRLDPSSLSRAGDHSERGRLTLAHLLVGSANHLDHHLRFIYAKRANLGISLYPRYSTHE